MDLSKILSISGKSGLFNVVSQMKNAVLVESLIDKKRFPAFAHEKISSLEEIAIFTTGEDKPLKDILKTMFENQEKNPAPDNKSDGKALAAYFESVVPDYDKERVYISDIKKIVGWYNLLLENNLLDFTENESENEKETEIEKPVEEVEEIKEKPKKATAKKTKKE
ncbi:MAG: DUF5606 domain-containing protein [Syntrophothermus sp.]